MLSHFITYVHAINLLCRFEKQDGVVLMATTRSLKKIDEALQRPGRMDRIFHLQLPTQAERERILQNAAKETMDPDLIDFVDWQKVPYHIFINYTITLLVFITYCLICFRWLKKRLFYAL